MPSTGSTSTPWPTEARPRITRAGRFSHADRGFAVSYRHETFALHLYEYPAAMRLGRRAFSLQPGDVTLTPPGEAARYDLPAPGHHWCVHFLTDEPADREAKRQRLALPLHVRLGARRPHAEHQLSEITYLSRRAPYDAAARLAAAAQLQALLLWLRVAATGEPGRGSGAAGEQAVRRAAELIESRLERELSVPDLAREVGLSQNYLARLFREHFNMTMPRYLLNKRIERAHDLLLSTSLSVSEIGQRVGLPDPQHFNKQFRQLIGISPTALRQRHGPSA